jgi:anti-sigma B factor antagonist
MLSKLQTEVQAYRVRTFIPRTTSGKPEGEALMLTVEKRFVGSDVAVLSLAGKLTLGGDCQQVERQLDDLLREGKLRVIFDLSGLSYIDSGGVGTLVMCLRKLKKSGGTLRVAGAAGKVEDTLKMINVHEVIQFFPTVEAAATLAATLFELLP